MASSSSTSSVHPAPPVSGFRIRDRELFPRSFAVCRIVRVSDKSLMGTGFLVEGDLVVTANHVIRRAKSIREFLAQFFVDVFDNNYKGHFSFELEFEDDPKKFFSSPAPKRVGGKYPPASATHLDYSILSLKPDPRLQKVPCFSLFKEKLSPFREQARAFVFQYPDELILDAFGNWISGDFQLATGTITKNGVNDYDVHYTTNSLPGSSGGPVTDELGNLVALNHKGKITSCSCPKIEGSHCNAGVRIDKILEDLTISGRRQEIDKLIEQNTLRIHLRLTEHITNFYRDQQTVSVLNQGEDWFFRIDDVYTDLAIIGHVERKKERDKTNSFQDRQIPTHETLYQPKTPIRIEQLFEQVTSSDNDTKKRAIIYGVAGVGKTTFSEMLAIHGVELWPNQFRTVFLVKLRNLNHANYHEKDYYSIEEVLAREYKISLQNSTDPSIPSLEFSCSLQELREFLHRESFKRESLLILDGFDELPIEANNGQGPLRNVIKDLEKMFDHILITSRPGTVKFRNVEMSCKTQFEITGFDEKSIDRYIKLFYEQLEAKNMVQLGSSALDKTTKLCAVLRERPILHNLVHIPINLTLICSIYNRLESSVDSAAKFSLTDFYLLTVAWLYQRFLDRSDVISAFQQDPDFDPLSSSLLKDLDKALQVIAWRAMKNDSIQFNHQTVKDTLSKKFQNSDHIVGNLKKVGLMKFEPVVGSTKPGDGTWEFIHLTFQEYFAALYFANFYVGGKTKKEKAKLMKKGQSELAKIKLNPRYILILRMTAGYLSHRVSESENRKDEIAYANNKIALQTFFDHLFDQPKDFAKTYALCFSAQCFEEVKNPEEIQPHYNRFVEDCVGYISKVHSESNLMTLLERNPKLCQHKMISDVICKLMQDPNKRIRILVVLRKKDLIEQLLSDDIIEGVEAIAVNVNFSIAERALAMIILKNILKTGRLISLETAKALQQMGNTSGVRYFLSDPMSVYTLYREELVQCDYSQYSIQALEKIFDYQGAPRIDTIVALEEIAKSKRVISSAVAKSFGIIDQGVKIDLTHRILAVDTLEQIVRNQEIIHPDLCYFEEILDESLPSDEIKLNATEEEMFEGVSQAIEDSSKLPSQARKASLKLRKRAVIALRKIGVCDGLASERALDALLKLFQTPGLGEELEGILVGVLVEVGLLRRKILNKIVDALIPIIALDVPHSTLSVQSPLVRDSINVLGGIAHKRNVIPEKVLRIFIDMLQGAISDQNLRQGVIQSLVEIVVNGRTISHKTIERVSMMLYRSPLEQRIAMEILWEIAKKGGVNSEEAIKHLALKAKNRLLALTWHELTLILNISETADFPHFEVVRFEQFMIEVFIKQPDPRHGLETSERKQEISPICSSNDLGQHASTSDVLNVDRQMVSLEMREHDVQTLGLNEPIFEIGKDSRFHPKAIIQLMRMIKKYAFNDEPFYNKLLARKKELELKAEEKRKIAEKVIRPLDVNPVLLNQLNQLLTELKAKSEIDDVEITQLFEMLKERSLEFHRSAVVGVLIRIVKEGGAHSEYITQQFMKIFLSDINDGILHYIIEKAIIQIVKEGGDNAQYLKETLMTTVQTQDLTEEFRINRIVVEIAKLGNEKLQYILKFLMEVFSSTSISERTDNQESFSSSSSSSSPSFSDFAIEHSLDKKDLASDENTRRNILDILSSVAKDGSREVGYEILKQFVIILNRENLSRKERKRVLTELLTLVEKQGGDSDELITTLIFLYTESEVDLELIVNILEKIVIGGCSQTEKIINHFRCILQNKVADQYTIVNVCRSLERIAKKEPMYCDEIFDDLVHALIDRNLSLTNSNSILRNINAVVKLIKRIPFEITDFLEKTIQNQQIGRHTRRMAFSAFAMIKEKRENGFSTNSVKIALQDMPFRADSDDQSGWSEDFFPNFTVGYLEQSMSIEEGLSEELMTAILQITEGDKPLSNDLQEKQHPNSRWAAIEVLSRISSNALIQSIRSTESAFLVMKICYLTGKAFSYFNGKICISDQRQQVSVICPQELDIEALQEIDGTANLSTNTKASSSFTSPFTHSLPSSPNSLSSSSSSSSSTSTTYLEFLHGDLS